MRSQRSVSTWFVTALTAVALGGICLGSPSTAHANPSVACESVEIPVSLGLLSPPSHLHAELCIPAGATTVQVLVPGATYNNIYWDFPFQPSTYSYVRAVNAAGYATLALDRLGTGSSSHPLSLTVTATLEAATVHQAIQAIRAGQVGAQPFTNVILVGHSLGSIISIIESATYHDVDGVIITGLTHRINAIRVALAFGTLSLYPALLDPAFAGQNLDLGYLTTRPGTRGGLFHSITDPVPEVIAVDEQTKDLVATTEVPDGILLGATLPLSRNIQAPVLVVVGGQDTLFCGLLATNCSRSASLLAAEGPYYGTAAELEAFVLPTSGHDVNLARNTPIFQTVAITWANQHVGH